MFDVGEAVKVIAHSRFEDYLDKYIGKIGHVCVSGTWHPGSSVRVTFDDGRSWWFAIEVLESAEEAKLSPGDLPGLFNQR